MKFSLRLGDATKLTPADAQACFAANCGFPGLGSILGGRWIGYVQAALAFSGFGLTAVFGTRFLLWAVQNWSTIFGPQADPIDTLTNLWFGCRWVLVGIMVFGFTWCWALLTSLNIRRQTHERAASGATPPIITPRFRP